MSLAVSDRVRSTTQPKSSENIWYTSGSATGGSCLTTCRGRTSRSRAVHAVSGTHTRGATVRRELITIPAGLAHRGRDQLILHLPQDWPWRDGFEGVFDATHCAPPTRAA